MRTVVAHTGLGFERRERKKKCFTCDRENIDSTSSTPIPTWTRATDCESDDSRLSTRPPTHVRDEEIVCPGAEEGEIVRDELSGDRWSFDVGWDTCSNTTEVQAHTE